jgi:exopolysaccharide biosynthesis WecB/TagA/CpsF family protein
MLKPDAVTLFDLGFADLTPDQAADRIAARPAGAPFAYVVTPNVDHLVRLAGDPALLGVYQKAWLCLLDSRVVRGLAGLIGLRAPRVATGSDLTERLLARHVGPNERITVIGLSPAWLPVLRIRYGLAQPSHLNPPMGFDRDPKAFAEAVAFVVANPSRLIFLAVGSPRQERLAAAIAATGTATGTALCIGASLEFLAGVRRRAPVAMRRAGLEWLFRLVSEPRRLSRRYLRDGPRIIGLMLRQRRRHDPACTAPPA